MDYSDICKHGSQSYFNDRGVYRNPYPNGSQEFDEFERGWMQSLKKDNGGLVKEKQFTGSALESSDYRPPVTHATLAEIDAKLYRQRKG